MSKYVKIADITANSKESADRIGKILKDNGLWISDADDTHLLVYEKVKRDKEIQEVMDYLLDYEDYSDYQEHIWKLRDYVEELENKLEECY